MYPDVPIILLSSLGNNSYNENAQLFASVLTKPIKQQALSLYILNALRKKTKQIPVAENVRQENKKQNLSEKYPLRILLAEDDMYNQLFALQVLEDAGFKPDVADNGVIAVEKSKQNNYDIILMDVQMPEIDGFEATTIIRQTLKKQPVIIAMTANALQGDREKSLQAGMDDYISKPVSS